MTSIVQLLVNFTNPKPSHFISASSCLLIRRYTFYILPERGLESIVTELGSNIIRVWVRSLFSNFIDCAHRNRFIFVIRKLFYAETVGSCSTLVLMRKYIIEGWNRGFICCLFTSDWLKLAIGVILYPVQIQMVYSNIRSSQAFSFVNYKIQINRVSWINLKIPPFFLRPVI